MKKTISTFAPLGGKHCITTSLRQIFQFYGHSLSEEMLFGLGEGLDFTYINLAAAPMISGRARVLELECALARHLGVSTCIKQSKDDAKVFSAAKQMIDHDQPVLAYVDMPFLNYFRLDPNSHFGGHTIVLFGYDDEQSQFLVSDRDNADHPISIPGGHIQQDYHRVSYVCMQAARASGHRPFPANNKYLLFDFGAYQGIQPKNLVAAINSVCNKMLSPPARLKGVAGIEKFSGEIFRWRKLNIDKRKHTGITNYFQIHTDGGTGGGIFRRMYGGFLREAAQMLGDHGVAQIGDNFRALSRRWDQLAAGLWQLGRTGDCDLLAAMSAGIAALAEEEAALLTQLQNRVKQ